MSWGKIILHEEILPRWDISDVSPFSTLYIKINEMALKDKVKPGKTYRNDIEHNLEYNIKSRYWEIPFLKFPAFLINSKIEKNPKHTDIQLFIWLCSQQIMSCHINVMTPMTSSLSPHILTPCPQQITSWHVNVLWRQCHDSCLLIFWLLVSDPGAPTLRGGAVTDVEGVSRPSARPQGWDHGDGLLVTTDITQLRLLHHDLAAVLAEPVHLELDDDPPLLLRHLVLLLLRSGLTDVIVSSDQLTTLNYLLLYFLTLEKLFNYFLKASTCQTVLALLYYV